MNQFNRIFRILWSKTKEQWVVTSELEGPGGKKQGKGLVSVFCAALVAAGMLSASPSEVNALAGTGGLGPVCTGTSANVAASLSGTCTISATDSLTIANTGIVNGNVVVDNTATAASIDNAGSIQGGTGSAISITAGASGVTISNQAGAVMSAASANRLGVIEGAGVATVQNSGVIDIYSVFTTYTSGMGSVYGLVDVPTLNNSSTGTISAKVVNNAPTASSLGLKATALRMSPGNAFSGTNVNSGTILASAVNNANNLSSTLALSASGVSGQIPSGTFTNDGTISASVTNHGTQFTTSSINLRANGFNSSVIGAVVTNNGVIEALSTNTGNSTSSGTIIVSARGVLLNVGGVFTNSSTGTITASSTNSGTATSSGESVIARGIVSFGNCQINNQGSISAVVSNAASNTNVNLAVGVNVSTGGTLDNTGTIEVGRLGTITANFAGVSLGSNNIVTPATLNNRGAIIGSSTLTKADKLYAVISSGAGLVNNLAGGVLQGAIVMNPIGTTVPEGSLVNAGLVDIPDNGLASTMLNYTQQAGGVLRLGATSAASFAKLTATGTADFTANNTLDIKVDPANMLVVGDVLTSVVSGGNLILPGGVVITDDSDVFDFNAAVNVAGTGIDLTVVAATGADTQVPVITLNGSSNVLTVLGGTYIDQGVTASDIVDGDVTANVVTVNTVITTVLGNYTVSYTVSDTAGNAAVAVVRHVQVIADTTPPVITLNGNTTETVVQNTTYTDAGVTALDNVDGDVSASVVTGGTFVNTSTVGAYTITYDVTDNASNAATQVVRHITVTAASTGGGSASPTLDPYATNNDILPGVCLAPTGTGLVPMLLSLFVGIGFMRRRKK